MAGEWTLSSPTRSRLSIRRKKREELIFSSLTRDQRLCAACLYPPLFYNGFIFSKELAWR
jgi:hypothetical protein